MGRKKRKWQRTKRSNRPAGVGQRGDWCPSSRIPPGRSILVAWYEPELKEQMAI